MTLSELQKKRDKLKAKLAKVEEEIKAADGLRLEVDKDGDLRISYKDSAIGFIGREGGYCNIINGLNMLNVYERWLADGMPINETPVKWKGMYDEGKYKLSVMFGHDVVLERIDIDFGLIYDFTNCGSCFECEDKNIYCFKHNNRPVIF